MTWKELVRGEDMNIVKSRLGEPSTYAGLSGLAILLGMTIEEFQVITNAVAGIFAVISVFRGEGGK